MNPPIKPWREWAIKRAGQGWGHNVSGSEIAPGERVQVIERSAYDQLALKLAEAERDTQAQSFKEYWCNGLGPLGARKVWNNKSDENKHLWLTALSHREAESAQLSALVERLAGVLEYCFESTCKHEGEIRAGIDRGWCHNCSSWVRASDWIALNKAREALAEVAEWKAGRT